MLAKVQYPDPNEGTLKQFDAEVPDDRPQRWVFTHPDDGREIPAVLVDGTTSWQPGGDVAIYRAEEPEES
jgi:hypothetical protein